MLERTSTHGFDETMRALVDAIEQRGLTIFALIDHAAGAREAGLELEDEQLILFGNPRAGTSLMQADRRVGIELPLRILVWLEGATVHVGYDDPRELAGRYDVEANRPTLVKMAALLEVLAAAAAD